MRSLCFFYLSRLWIALKACLSADWGRSIYRGHRPSALAKEFALSSKQDSNNNSDLRLNLNSALGVVAVNSPFIKGAGGLTRGRTMYLDNKN